MRFLIFLAVRRWSLLLAGVAWALCTGCTRTIIYSRAAAGDAELAAVDGPLRLYFDRDGSLYPAAAAGVRIDPADLAARNGYLFEYFTSNQHGTLVQRQAQQHRLWQYYDPAADPDTLNLSQPDREQRWRSLQQVMRRHAAAALTAELARRKPTLLVVLIHGFNTHAASTRTWYDTVTADVRRHQPAERIQFVEVYWDGGKSSSPLPLLLWKYAQYNMYGVGLALRQVLAGTAEADLPPTRIFTHSTGGPLLCVALWNSATALGSAAAAPITESPMPGVPTFWGQSYRWLQHQPAFRTPRLPQLRVAMLAPAMPGAHFHEFLRRTPAEAADSTGRCERILFGQNRHDIATGKSILVSSRWSWIGATSLGVRPDEYFAFVRPEVDGKPYVRTKTYLLDFTGHGTPYHAHGVLEFRKNHAAYQGLLNAWLGAGPPPAAPWLVSKPSP